MIRAAIQAQGLFRNLAFENRSPFRTRLAVGERYEDRLHGVLILDSEDALMDVGVDLGVEVGPSVKNESDLAGLIALLEFHDRCILEGAVMSEQQLVSIHMKD